MEAIFESLFGIPEIDCTLSIEPKLRRVAKQTGEPYSHLRRDGTPLSKQFIDSLA